MLCCFQSNLFLLLLLLFFFLLFYNLSSGTLLLTNHITVVKQNRCLHSDTCANYMTFHYRPRAVENRSVLALLPVLLYAVYKVHY